MNHKLAIGCLVQWYEIGIIDEYLETLSEALDEYLGEVVVDFTIISGEQLEKCLNTELKNSIIDNLISKLDNLTSLYNVEYRVIDTLYSIADYRRDFNNKYCTEADLLIWGETDMLVPKEMFTSINAVHTAVSQQSPKYILTFGINKMWDDSWKPLEHPLFSVKNHSDSTHDWWGVRYVTTKEEMNSINKSVIDLDVVALPSLKFNGCGLVISSELVKAGANIPKSVFFVHEDTSFLLMLQKLYNNIPQYHIRNLYLPHNRKHPKKRMYITGEENMDKGDIGKLRKSHEWYVKGNKYSEENCYNLFSPTHIAKSWKDVFSENT